jgi:uncharacterized membrane protein YgaE (UPF0421/DUF939 family)
VQSGVAAGLAWLFATKVFHDARPYFAPIAAVIVLGAAGGQRLRRALELAGGVALGVAVGDSLILLIGVGPLQIATVVTLAIIAIDLLGGGSVAAGQAAAAAVLVATLAPPTTGIYFTRLLDALIGAVTALVVMSLLLPFNPLTRVKRAAGRCLSLLAEALTVASRSIGKAEPGLADGALATLRARDRDREELRDALTIGQETATVAPLRWPSRAALARYADAAVYIDRATRSVRVIESRLSTLLRDGERAPNDLAVSLKVLARGVTSLNKELADGRDAAGSRSFTLEAVRAAASAYSAGLGLSGSVVVAQLDSAAVDLLCASGLRHRNASALVGQASAAARPAAGDGH